MKDIRKQENFGITLMNEIYYFDYYKAAKEMSIPKDILDKIEKEVKEEFPSDRMMYELHVLRALKSRYWEKVSSNTDG